MNRLGVRTVWSERNAASELADMAVRIRVQRRFKVPMRVQSWRSKLSANLL
jgi:hypothetical protein